MEVNTNYNAPTSTKLAVLAGTALTSFAYMGYAMKRHNVKSLKNLEMGIREGVELCVASTVGGLAAGLATDKPDTHKYKLKDSVNQLVGNTFIPFGCLAVANKFTTKLPKPIQTAIAVGTLFVTTFLGHDVANWVNKKVFKEDSNYKCSFKDFATDADDILFSASTVLKNKSLYQFTATICPLTYMTHGYLSGTRQKDEYKPTLDRYA